MDYDRLMTRPRTIVLLELAREEARLGELGRAREDARRRIESLRAELAVAAARPATFSAPMPPLDRSAPRTFGEKVDLFRSLFRGRTDVFPVRFVGKKTGKPGYAPACSNKWEPGSIPCSSMRPAGFSPSTSTSARGGKTLWRLPRPADRQALPSRSSGPGQGTARTPGSSSLHRCPRMWPDEWAAFSSPTMSRRHELSMDSYDRLFPNQDTMPRGGFGNLIALPLQHDARQKGNSVFIDEQLEAYADQWAFLASVERMEPAAAEAIAREATRTGQVIGVRPSEDLDDDASAAPWMRLPPGRITISQIADPLPSEVTAVLSQRLFIEKAGLPAGLLNQLKRLAAFQNPEFYKRQRMRLSTALTPRVITCAEELTRDISLPRGCAFEVRKLFEEYGVALAVDDKRHDGAPLEVKFKGELTVVQKQMARALLEHEEGVLVAPPGIGKTVLGTYLVARRARSALILVHRKPLLEQWIAQLAIFLDVDEKQIGRIGGGQRRPNGRLDVAMVQSLVRKGEIDDLIADYGHVVVDECHHLPAVSFERILSEVKARYVVGLTATPQRRDGHQPITQMQLGPVRFRMDTRSQAAHRPFDHRLIVRDTGFRLVAESEATSIQEIYRMLANDDARNSRIVEDVITAIHEGRSPILLTERKDHLEYFAERLRRFVRHMVVLRGGMTAKERQRSADQLASIPDTAERLVVATGRYIGEGFDDPRLDTLFLALPVSWKGTLIQYSGRLHRHHPAKTEVRIYDYLDREDPMLLRMFEKRLATYRVIGYARREAPLGFAEPPDELTIEYDEEALRHLPEDA